MIEVVRIPDGEFLMGSPDREGDNDEHPQHLVTVPAFFIAKTPITQAQYQTIMGNNPSYFKGENRPVEQVSWFDAVEFCQRLSQLTGQEYRLPSEAEWEHACRAGTVTPFYTVSWFDFGDTITPEQANYCHTNQAGTTEVGSFPPNAFGLYDMHGNVWEWCADNWHDNYEGAPTDSSAWISEKGKDRPLRGGSWISLPAYCRSAARGRSAPELKCGVYGFRVCRSLMEGE